MDSSSCDQLDSPWSLKSLACDVMYPHGNYLIHQFVLDSSERRKSCSESDIRATLRSFPDSRVDASNEDGFTALHLAVMKRSSFMVKMLLSSCMATIDVNAKCVYSGGTALHFATAEDYFDGDFSKAKKYYSKTQLDKDVKGKCLEIINVLLASGAIIDIKDNRGITPLHVAAKENEIDIIKLLISNGAELNKKDESVFGYTPLHHAINVSGLETVKLLVESGADADKKSNLYETPLYLAVTANLRDITEYLISIKVDLNTLNGKGSPLHSAVIFGSLEMVDYLVRNGALLNARNVWGETPLYVAAEEDKTDMIRVLISKGADLSIKNKKGNNPLHAAIWKSNLETVKLLVESGADINEKCSEGYTPFSLAFIFRGDRRDVIEYLISKNADLNTIDEIHWTPLHSAVRKNRLGYVKILVESGALLNMKDGRGQTPLHIAALDKNVDITEFLIGSGADVNAKDSEGRTPLHEAVCDDIFPRDILEEGQNSCLRTVEVLVKSGADVEAADKNGVTPLSMAERQNCIEIVELLKSRESL